MEKVLIEMNSAQKMLLNTIFANQDKLIWNRFFQFWLEMMIMEPVFTLITFNHEFIHIIKRVRFLAIAVAIKVVLVVVILLIFIILFLVI
jgi:hypothetical protein